MVLVVNGCLGGSAWTSDESSYNQWIRFKLPSRKRVTAVVTAGRAKTKEYVTEYILQYSDDGENWRSYVTASGIPQVLTHTHLLSALALFLRLLLTNTALKITTSTMIT